MDNSSSTSIKCNKCIHLDENDHGFFCYLFKEQLRTWRERLVLIPVKCMPCVNVGTINPGGRS